MTAIISPALAAKLRAYRASKAVQPVAKPRPKPPAPKPQVAKPAKTAKPAPAAIPSVVASKNRRKLYASGAVAPYQRGGSRADWMAHLRELKSAMRKKGKP